jgi:hypothetical protein
LAVKAQIATTEPSGKVTPFISTCSTVMRAVSGVIGS